MPAPVTAWIPGDFGHDPNLPIVVQAMGSTAAGFERIPGQRPPLTTISGGPSLATQLTESAIDFVWKADDGSTILAHWLIGGYGQGVMVDSNVGDGNDLRFSGRHPDACEPCGVDPACRGMFPMASGIDAESVGKPSGGCGADFVTCGMNPMRTGPAEKSNQGVWIT